VDFAMIMGAGWAPFRGGPLRYADSVGISNVVARLQQLREDRRDYFAPCARLTDMVNQGSSFYLAGPNQSTAASSLEYQSTP
jgi:3-hydroxyacyl-CoA dehydrogenase / enoyl-CoA hydratase / 3-hydroxybutyryl-CoA epimerase